MDKEFEFLPQLAFFCLLLNWFSLLVPSTTCVIGLTLHPGGTNIFNWPLLLLLYEQFKEIFSKWSWGNFPCCTSLSFSLQSRSGCDEVTGKQNHHPILAQNSREQGYKTNKTKNLSNVYSSKHNEKTVLCTGETNSTDNFFQVIWKVVWKTTWFRIWVVLAN